MTPEADAAWRRRVRRGAATALVALAATPVTLAASVLLPSFLSDPRALQPYLPLVPAFLLSAAAAGAVALSSARAGADRTWAIASSALLGLGAAFAVALAALSLARPDGSWAALAAPRGPLALLGAWALSERIAQVQRALDAPRPDSIWEDAGSLALLLGLPLMLPQVWPSLPDARDLLGGLARPLSLLMLAGAVLGAVRLGSLLLGVARGGDERDL
jgi:hypothetical protein